MFQYLTLKEGGIIRFNGNQTWQIISLGTIGNSTFPSIHNVLLVNGMKHNLLSISQLFDIDYK